MDGARRAAESAARTSYSRLLAILAARSRDIAGAEDALAEAFLSAMRTWPDRGVPAKPDAWLLTAARNSMKNIVRHQSVIDGSAAEIERSYLAAADEKADLPDERLKLLFVCAHPAIDEDIRTPLMLQTVLGLDAVRIGNAFLVHPAAMGQRLVRAKAKIKLAGLRFDVPPVEDLPDRVVEVLNAIYAAYGAGWDAVTGLDTGAGDLTEEAIFLGRLLVHLLPEEAEAKGLLALMLYCEARRAARRDADGKFIPLARQDARLWSREMIVEAEGLLSAASGFARFGRFQCEAAIQSVHVQRPILGRTNHAALKQLYGLLVAYYPSVGALVGQASVLVEAGEPAAALRILGELPPGKIDGYQPYWVTRANGLRALGEIKAADAALQTAIGLTKDQATRDFLLDRNVS